MLLFFDFAAMPPEVSYARLLIGPGVEPMAATAAAYAGVADALTAAAGGSDGSMNSMSVTWKGASSDLAQSAFRNHANWLREQAAVAAQVSEVAATVAAAYSAAAATAMTQLPVVIANRAIDILLHATNGMGQNLPAIAVNEGIYMGMWMAAAANMYNYAGVSLSALGEIPPPVAPPPITTGGGPDLPPTHPNPPNGPTHDVTTTTIGQETVGTDTTDTNSGDKTGDPISDPTRSDPQQAVSDVDRAMSSLTDSLADPGLNGAGDGYLDQHGFQGTSPYSSTLNGLSGGMGSVAAIGMMRGGLGAMAGSSTGFRMPANWTPGPGRAFGATPGSMTTAPVSRRTAPRGVTAPKALMRGRDEDEYKSGKVFVPGEAQEVPVLEIAPVIGVIEYADGERQDEAACDQSLLLVGVLERFDDDVERLEEDSVLAIEERPR